MALNARRDFMSHIILNELLNVFFCDVSATEHRCLEGIQENMVD